MNFFSTKNKAISLSIKEASLQSMPNDGGLYIPETIPHLPEINDCKTLVEGAQCYLSPFYKECLNQIELNNIVKDAFNFDCPTIKLNENLFILELFHGPTLAFKDFGARFMARAFRSFKDNSKDSIVLVATSGDTGSAVANGFYNLDGFKVVILFPKNRISKLQELQMTTLGNNVTAVEVDGSFDDCQKLVKEAFLNKNYKNNNINLTSANSINISRLLPQAVYYIWSRNMLSILHGINCPNFVVPSGNLGNICAGLFAKKAGLNCNKFTAALNNNDTFHTYLNSGSYLPKNSVETLSTAMDVGNPSNFQRIEWLYNNNLNNLKKDVSTSSISNEKTAKSMQLTYNDFNYICDPHTSVGIAATDLTVPSVVLSTAHPIKFKEIVESTLDMKLDVPDSISKLYSLNSNKLDMPNSELALQDLIMSL